MSPVPHPTSSIALSFREIRVLRVSKDVVRIGRPMMIGVDHALVFEARGVSRVKVPGLRDHWFSSMIATPRIHRWWVSVIEKIIVILTELIGVGAT